MISILCECRQQTPMFCNVLWRFRGGAGGAMPTLLPSTFQWSATEESFKIVANLSAKEKNKIYRIGYSTNDDFSLSGNCHFLEKLASPKFCNKFQ